MKRPRECDEFSECPKPSTTWSGSPCLIALLAVASNPLVLIKWNSYPIIELLPLLLSQLEEESSILPSRSFFFFQRKEIVGWKESEVSGRDEVVGNYLGRLLSNLSWCESFNSVFNYILCMGYVLLIGMWVKGISGGGLKGLIILL